MMILDLIPLDALAPVLCSGPHFVRMLWRPGLVLYVPSFRAPPTSRAIAAAMTRTVVTRGRRRPPDRRRRPRPLRRRLIHERVWVKERGKGAVSGWLWSRIGSRESKGADDPDMVLGLVGAFGCKVLRHGVSRRRGCD